ncbi:carboxylesterase family protein [Leeuwenhoekiella marinoflava]|uniref:Phospholipase/carboxylesterase n=2 Tax=Leeuwenhoekiella marinoflava TaxID=988 RepID=A0A4Q0PN28_9FLAO|nr:prolyl oligopeptidase family serine peptidase [Leeuwenhoekiella marinoflava]RXG31887.1 phospholipase/carboxylesterase [Leeuwenhoekiella marinoflava]SHE90424.1 Alpha/beta hydrolase family protein [Leeuwenhoekiella marinoflava DSM 3653]
MKIQFAILVTLLYSGIVLAQNSFKKAVYQSAGDSLQYRIQYPLNYDKTKQYPLILFLHGAGERGSDNQSQLTHGASVFTNTGNRNAFPAIVIFPQCPKDSYWANVDVDRSTYPIGITFHPENKPTPHLKMAAELVNSFIEDEKIDTSRVYVAGLSMGGMGTYEIVQRNPDTFAAAIAICGAGSTESVKDYALKTPFWVIHGADDNVVKPTYSLQMAEAMLDAGAKPRVSIYEHANHNSWDSAFAEPDFLQWLFSHTKAN